MGICLTNSSELFFSLSLINILDVYFVKSISFCDELYPKDAM